MPTPILRRVPLLVLGLLLALPAPILAAPHPAAPQDGGEPKPDEKKPEDPKPEEPAEDDKEAQAKRAEEIEAFLKQYEDQLSKMTDQDAIDGLAKLKGWYVDPKVADDSKKAIRNFFGSKVVKVRGREAYLEAAAKTLGEMGGEEVVPYIKYLVEYGYSVKGFIQGVVRAGLTSFGKIAPVKGADVKWLTDQLKGKGGKDDFVPDVCIACGGYDRAPGTIRKDIFEDLLKRSEGVYSKSEGNDNVARRAWNIWGSDIVEAMQKLSGKADTKTPPDFRRWFNDNSPGGGKNPRTWADTGGQ